MSMKTYYAINATDSNAQVLCIIGRYALESEKDMVMRIVQGIYDKNTIVHFSYEQRPVENVNIKFDKLDLKEYRRLGELKLSTDEKKEEDVQPKELSSTNLYEVCTEVCLPLNQEKVGHPVSPKQQTVGHYPTQELAKKVVELIRKIYKKELADDGITLNVYFSKTNKLPMGSSLRTELDLKEYKRLTHLSFIKD